jgi:hypothetical protein
VNVFSLQRKLTAKAGIFKQLFNHLTTPLVFGLLIGLLLNISGGRAFFTFLVKHSLIDGLYLFAIFGLLLVTAYFSWIESNEIGKSKTANLRMYLLGISFASLVVFIVNIVPNLYQAHFVGGIMQVYGDFPFVTIMGIPFHSIIWSLFSAILFSTIERVLKVWEDSLVSNPDVMS